MADQDEDLVVQLGEDLYASAHGEAAEAARLIDLNAPVKPQNGGGSGVATHDSCSTRAH
jgi:hypothetical protein